MSKASFIWNYMHLLHGSRVVSTVWDGSPRSNSVRHPVRPSGTARSNSVPSAGCTRNSGQSPRRPITRKVGHLRHFRPWRTVPDGRTHEGLAASAIFDRGEPSQMVERRDSVAVRIWTIRWPPDSACVGVLRIALEVARTLGLDEPRLLFRRVGKVLALDEEYHGTGSVVAAGDHLTVI